MQNAGPAQDTAIRALISLPCLGLGVIDQRLPSQVSTSAWPIDPVEPTATQLVALRQATSLRPPLLYRTLTRPLTPLLGLGVIDQCCPSHVSIRVVLAALGPLWPTATQNTGLAQETPTTVSELSPGIDT